jgi:dihydroorotate dehydrogenase electron transfer subunit
MAKILECTVLNNYAVDDKHYVINLTSKVIANFAVPGQFVEVLASKQTDPLLRRPISIYEVNKEEGTFSLLYRVVGKGTDLISKIEIGSVISVVGPLGKGFAVEKGQRVLVTAGGIGVAPLKFLADYLKENLIEYKLVFAARNKEHLVNFDNIRKEVNDLQCVTEDGSIGASGLVTDAIRVIMQQEEFDLICACGPNPMLEAIAKLGQELKLPTQVSLESHMACGFGVCLGCIVPATDGSYVKVCNDGPVFPGDRIW